MTIEPRRYVQPEVGEARINRLWGSVSARLEARPGRLWRRLALGTGLCVAAAGLLFAVKAGPFAGFGPSERALPAEAKLETASDALAVTLVEGSKVKLGARTEVRVRDNKPNAVVLSLARGELSCDVTHHEGRKFSIVVGDVEVKVIGTQFSVKTGSGAEPRVEVSVQRGVVEVVKHGRADQVTRVAAGQTWFQPPAERAAAGDGVTSTTPAPAVSEAVEPALPDVDAKGAAKPVASVAAALPAARELFEKAGESRRAGDAAAAARAYEELLRLHPSDARAGLSAFELGRLRMDRLGDSAGAGVALERALALNIGPSFREDALARLVSVYASQANFAACARARDRYLASYPAGVHASAVASRCGSR